MTEKKCEKLLKYYKEKEIRRWKLIKFTSQLISIIIAVVITIGGFFALKKIYDGLDIAVAFLSITVIILWALAEENLKILEEL